MGIARQLGREIFAILTLKPRSRVRILIYLTWANEILELLFLVSTNLLVLLKPQGRYWMYASLPLQKRLYILM